MSDYPISSHLDRDTIVALDGRASIGEPVQIAAATIQAKAEHDAALIRALIDNDQE